MSVQCKNCANAVNKGTKTKCIAYKNGGLVNPKKQRLCARYINKQSLMKTLEDKYRD
ncbi:hypothetical protein [Clostridium baratii]|uniref:hypothetical protein n=1 Tax=Clostridium baratii TaxID=1561 RepID=UPI0030CCAA42